MSFERFCRWVRPYRWPPGGAIASGAAIGVTGAAAVAARASGAPNPVFANIIPSQAAGTAPDWSMIPKKAQTFRDYATEQCDGG